MTHPTAATLVALGAQRLAAALMELAGQSEEAARLVERLTTAPDTGGHRFRSHLTALKRRKAFVPRRHTGAYASELRALLEDLEAGVTDPRTGVELVGSFYRADTAIFDACDDSDGLVGDIFRLDARDLFARYAARCEDKSWVGQRVLTLLAKDEFGVRDAVLKGVASFLPEPVLRDLAARWWQAAKSAGIQPDHQLGGEGRRWMYLVEDVARQLKDPRLFEQARRTHNPELGVAARVDIAEVWLAAGDPATALAWLEQAPPGGSFMAGEREQLLIAIYDRLGRRDDLVSLLWGRFNRLRSEETLEALLAVIGPERRDEVVTGAVNAILGAEAFSAGDAAFLLTCDQTDQAARYVLERRGQLDGDQWSALVPLAQALDERGRTLAATVLYRALLDSILARARSTIYHHGARYYRRLGVVAPRIAGWDGVITHDEYVAGLRTQHARKSSFWARCSEVE